MQIAAAAALAIASLPLSRAEPIIGAAGVLTRVVLTDNLFLTREGKENGGLLQLLPYVSGGRTAGNSTYRYYYGPSALFYGGGYSELNRVFQVMQLDGNIQFIDDYLGLRVTGRANQNLVNPAAANVGFNALGNPNAFAQTASLEVAPVIRFPIMRGDFAKVELVPGINYVIGSDAGADNSGSGSLGTQSSFSVISGPYFSRMPWTINGYSNVFRNDNSQGNNGNNGNNQGYSNVTGTATYSITPRWQIQALVGYEGGNYDSIYSNGGWQWRITPFWTPSQNTSVGLGYGYRYFGSDYYANIQYNRKKTSLSFTYETTVSNARNAIANGDVVSFQDSFGEPIIDPLSSSQVLSGSVSNPPLVSGFYVQNQMTGSIAHRFGRTTGTFTLQNDRWEYQASDVYIDQSQGNLTFNRALSPTSSASLGLQYWTYNQSNASLNDFDQYQLSAQWRYQLNAGLYSSIGYFYSQRTSDAALREYDQNQIWLTLVWAYRHR